MLLWYRRCSSRQSMTLSLRFDRLIIARRHSTCPLAAIGPQQDTSSIDQCINLLFRVERKLIRRSALRTGDVDGRPAIHAVLQEVRGAAIEQRLAAVHVPARRGQMQRRTPCQAASTQYIFGRVVHNILVHSSDEAHTQSD